MHAPKGWNDSGTNVYFVRANDGWNGLPANLVLARLSGKRLLERCLERSRYPFPASFRAGTVERWNENEQKGLNHD